MADKSIGHQVGGPEDRVVAAKMSMPSGAIAIYGDREILDHPFLGGIYFIKGQEATDDTKILDAVQYVGTTHTSNKEVVFLYTTERDTTKATHPINLAKPLLRDALLTIKDWHTSGISSDIPENVYRNLCSYFFPFLSRSFARRVDGHSVALGSCAYVGQYTRADGTDGYIGTGNTYGYTYYTAPYMNTSVGSAPYGCSVARYTYTYTNQWTSTPLYDIYRLGGVYPTTLPPEAFSAVSLVNTSAFYYSASSQKYVHEIFAIKQTVEEESASYSANRYGYSFSTNHKGTRVTTAVDFLKKEFTQESLYGLRATVQLLADGSHASGVLSGSANIPCTVQFSYLGQEYTVEGLVEYRIVDAKETLTLKTLEKSFSGIVPLTGTGNFSSEWFNNVKYTIGEDAVAESLPGKVGIVWVPALSLGFTLKDEAAVLTSVTFAIESPPASVTIATRFYIEFSSMFTARNNSLPNIINARIAESWCTENLRYYTNGATYTDPYLYGRVSRALGANARLFDSVMYSSTSGTLGWCEALDATEYTSTGVSANVANVTTGCDLANPYAFNNTAYYAPSLFGNSGFSLNSGAPVQNGESYYGGLPWYLEAHNAMGSCTYSQSKGGGYRDENSSQVLQHNISTTSYCSFYGDGQATVISLNTGAGLIDSYDSHTSASRRKSPRFGLGATGALPVLAVSSFSLQSGFFSLEPSIYYAGYRATANLSHGSCSAYHVVSRYSGPAYVRSGSVVATAGTTVSYDYTYSIATSAELDNTMATAFRGCVVAGHSTSYEYSMVKGSGTLPLASVSSTACTSTAVREAFEDNSGHAASTGFTTSVVSTYNSAVTAGPSARALQGYAEGAVMLLPSGRGYTGKEGAIVLNGSVSMSPYNSSSIDSSIHEFAALEELYETYTELSLSVQVMSIANSSLVLRICLTDEYEAAKLVYDVLASGGSNSLRSIVYVHIQDVDSAQIGGSGTITPSTHLHNIASFEDWYRSGVILQKDGRFLGKRLRVSARLLVYKNTVSALRILGPTCTISCEMPPGHHGASVIASDNIAEVWYPPDHPVKAAAGHASAVAVSAARTDWHTSVGERILYPSFGQDYRVADDSLLEYAGVHSLTRYNEISSGQEPCTPIFGYSGVSGLAGEFIAVLPKSVSMVVEALHYSRNIRGTEFVNYTQAVNAIMGAKQDIDSWLAEEEEYPSAYPLSLSIGKTMADNVLTEMGDVIVGDMRNPDVDVGGIVDDILAARLWSNTRVVLNEILSKRLWYRIASAGGSLSSFVLLPVSSGKTPEAPTLAKVTPL